jgi:hypothetical protein
MPWNAKTSGNYTLSDNEGQENTDEIARLLQAINYIEPAYDNWSIEAIAALVGNVLNEGGLNPWRWESDIVPTVQQFNDWESQGTGSNHGYGLFGFTSPWRYINSTNATRYSQWGYGPNFLDSAGNVNDGDAQILFMLSEIKPLWRNRGPTWVINRYGNTFSYFGLDSTSINNIANMTFDDFIEGNYTIDELAASFMVHYEAPSENPEYNHLDRRMESAREAYEYLTGVHPEPGFIINANTWKFYLY